MVLSTDSGKPTPENSDVSGSGPPNALPAHIGFKKWQQAFIERGLRNVVKFTIEDVTSLVDLIPLISSEMYIS